MYKNEIITNEKYKQFLINPQNKHETDKLIIDFISETEKINISNELVATLEKEFELFKIKVKKIMKKY